jgi:short-subunit dehydrogenase
MHQRWLCHSQNVWDLNCTGRNDYAPWCFYDIFITDIIPGWVEIEAIDVHKIPQAYWIATTEEAARQIVDAIMQKKKKAYITARWQLIALLYAICPDWLYNYLGGF